MTRRVHALGVVVACALVGACGVPHQDTPTQLDNNRVHLAAPATTTTLAIGTPTGRVELCLIRGNHLIENPTGLPAPQSVRKTLQALLDISQSALPAGTRSALTQPNLFTAGATTRGIANIDLDFANIPPATQILAIAQIVCTLTSLPGIGQVRFTNHGRPIDVPRADSSLTNQPVSRDDYKALIPNT